MVFVEQTGYTGSVKYSWPILPDWLLYLPAYMPTVQFLYIFIFDIPTVDGLFPSLSTGYQD